MSSISNKLLRSSVVAAGLFVTTSAMSAETLKIGFIDPLSGGFANVGDIALKHWLFAADEVNEQGGIAGKNIEVLSFDNKVKADESLVQLQKAIDQGVKIIVQSVGSSVGHALSDAINKHNKRNPGEEIIYLNYGAIDPALTNDDCNFWHFSFDANVDMKMVGLVEELVDQREIESIYVIAQNYSYGKAFAAAAKNVIGEKRPDIKILASELHPVSKVKDFSPYIQKIKNSGADAVFTGNWGSDLTLLVKAGESAGLTIPFYTYYGDLAGAPAAMGKSALGRIKQVSGFHENVPSSASQEERQIKFETKFPGVDYYYQRVFTMLDMLKKAADKTNSTDVVKMAFALEGMSVDTPFGEVVMRAEDHQLLAPLYVSSFSDDVKYDVEDTGYGFKTEKVVLAEKTALTTSCKMKRP